MAGHLLWSLACAFVLGATLASARAAEPEAPQPREIAAVTLPFAPNRVPMQVHVYRPDGDGPFPVVLYLHGRPPNAQERRSMASPIPAGHAGWWLRRGVAVVAPLRPGYGSALGPDPEDSGVRWRGSQCTGRAEFTRAAGEAARAALASYEWVLRQPWARRDRLLVEGWSFGGLAAAAVAAQHPAGLLGIVNFSGGTAGNPHGSPGRSCQADALGATFAELGRQARVPSLWLYAENDSYWGADAPRQWHAAYRAGGSDAALIMAPALPGTDGHLLLQEGGDHWDEPLQRFAERLGLLAP